MAVAVVVLAVLWNGSDFANTDLRTAAGKPSVPTRALPGDSVTLAWSAGTGPADTYAVEASTVITGNEHGLAGLDQATGEERWHYLRSTATLCDWTGADDVVVAVFRTDGGCDEAVALDADTGQRRWYRSVSFLSAITLRSTDQLTVAFTPTGLTVLGTVTNGLRWRYDPPGGCLIGDALPGDVGVVVALDCPEAGSSLVVLDGFTGEQRWTATPAGGPLHLLSASGDVGVLSGSAQARLQVFDRDGVQLTDLVDPALAVEGSAVPRAIALPDRYVLTTGSAVLLLDLRNGSISWVRPATTAAVLLGKSLLVYNGTDFAQLDLVTGGTQRSIAAAGEMPPRGATLELLGSSIVVGAADQVRVYR